MSNTPHQLILEQLLCVRSAPLTTNTREVTDLKKARAAFLQTSETSLKRNPPPKPMYTDTRPGERGKKIQAPICSCLQTLFSCLSNKMSLSAR